MKPITLAAPSGRGGKRTQSDPAIPRGRRGNSGELPGGWLLCSKFLCGREGASQGATPGGSMVLTAADLAFFAEHGWVVAKGVISREQAARTAQEVWDFAGLDPDDPDSWYAEEDGATPRPINTLMYHGQAEWENRVAPRVHEAFAAIWGSERLWTSHDSVNLNLPSRDPEAGEHAMHWDCDLRLLSLAEAKAERPIVGGVQGVLYLVRRLAPPPLTPPPRVPTLTLRSGAQVDTPPENGAFECLDGFHLKLDAWLDTLPEGTESIVKAMNEEFRGQAHRVGASAGDLVICGFSAPLPLPLHARLRQPTSPPCSPNTHERSDY